MRKSNIVKTGLLLFIIGLKEVDARLQAEAAGGANLLKSIVIRLEDARILENIDDMRKRLMQLKNINGDLIREHEIRLNSHRELAASLKELNIGVQRVARLRGKVFITQSSSLLFLSCRYHIYFCSWESCFQCGDSLQSSDTRRKSKSSCACDKARVG